MITQTFTRERFQLLLFIVFLIIGLEYAYEMAWLSEDSYISFRYAQNFVEGNGLVFNPGEQVEGYTNFLWTILIAAGIKLGFSPGNFALGLGIFINAISLIFLFLFHRRIFGKGILFPVTLAALSVNYTWACFATSGLETSLVTCLAIIGAYFLPLDSDEEKTNLKLFGAGLCFILATMTRPDASLFFIVASVFLGILLLKRRLSLANFFIFALPFVIIYLPYFVWRYEYYGYFFPNTYYAKAAGSPYYSQGLIYLKNFILRYSLWLLLPFWPVAIIISRARSSFNLKLWLMQAFSLVYVFYIVRVGGDFMEGRFFIPVLPFLFMVLEGSIRNIFKSKKLRAICLAAMVIINLFGVRQIAPASVKDGIADETSWNTVIDLWLFEGKIFRKHLPAGTIIGTNAIGALGYTSRLPIIDLHGLTDEVVAHVPIVTRGRPGHEKWAPMEYLKKRNVAFIRLGTRLKDWKPDWHFATNYYYLFNKDPEFVKAFKSATTEITKKLKGQLAEKVSNR